MSRAPKILDYAPAPRVERGRIPKFIARAICGCILCLLATCLGGVLGYAFDNGTHWLVVLLIAIFQSLLLHFIARHKDVLWGWLAGAIGSGFVLAFVLTTQ